MAQVSVTIDGKSYRMACDEGQEEHLAGLGRRFDAYVGHLRTAFGEIGDQRLLVMAAMMVMDELADAERRLDSATTKLAAAESARAKLDAAITRGSDDNEKLLEQIAERIEGLAGRVRAGSL